MNNKKKKIDYEKLIHKYALTTMLVWLIIAGAWMQTMEIGFFGLSDEIVSMLFWLFTGLMTSAAFISGWMENAKEN